MKINNVKLGTIEIPVKKFIEFLIDSSLANQLDLQVLDDGNIKFISKEQNIRMMEESDPRIVKLKRKYLFTYAMTREQQDIMLDFFKRNHFIVEFAEPVSSWLYATMSEANLNNNGGAQWNQH